MKPELRFSFVLNLFLLCSFVFALPSQSFGQLNEENPRAKVNEPYEGATKSTSSAISVQNYTGSTTSNPLHPQMLVKDLLVSGCIQTSNITFSGDRRQIGRFDLNPLNPNFPLSSGIIISTGKVLEAVGPNGSPSRTTEFSGTAMPDADLQALTGASSSYIKDKAVLTFDFVPDGNVVEFRYVFASDEYPEWACSQYNDVFGFFVSGPGISGPFSNNSKNIALLPDGQPVSINNIHVAGWDQGIGQSGPNSGCPDKNAAYYVSVPAGETTIEYDGRTVVFTARLENLVPCQTYKIKIAIADLVDSKYDSSVFLEAKSFSSSGSGSIKNFYNNSEKYDVFQGCQPNELRFYRSTDSDLNTDYTVEYQIAGSAISGTHYSGLPASGVTHNVVIPAGQHYVAMQYTVPVVVVDGTKTIVVKVNEACLCDNTPQWVEKEIRIHDPFQLKTFSTTPQTLCTQNNGSLTVMAGSGASNYDYVFTYRLYNSSNNLLSTQSTGANINLTFPNLGSDSYTIRITEASSCHEIVQAGIIVQSPDAPELSLTSNSPVCLGETIQLNSSSSTTGLSYSWSGPAGFASNAANPAIANANAANVGTYNLVVTAPNNCTATRGIDVVVNPLPSVSITAQNAGVINCLFTSINLTATASSNGTFSWSGPNAFVAEGSVANVSNPGLYEVVFVDGNGCAAYASVTVVQDVEVPTVTISGNQTLTCATIMITLVAEASDDVVSYLWSNGATTASIDVTMSGLYSVEVTAANGCKSSDEVNVDQNIVEPVVEISGNQTLTCATTMITLVAEASDDVVSYLWSNGATTASIDVTLPGLYSVEVTAANGCKSSDFVTVEKDTDVPSVEISGNQTLTCATTMITLVAEASDDVVSYLWSNGATTASIDVTLSGLYSVEVTAANGCKASDFVTVEQDIETPIVSHDPIAPVCIDNLPILLGNGMYSGNGVYLEEGSYYFAADVDGQFTITYSEIGENGCIGSSSVTLTILPLPVVSCPADITIGVFANAIVLTGASPEGGVYSGVGVEAGMFYPAVASVGAHTITYTYQDSEGCENTCEFVITVISMPDFSCIPSFAVCSTDEPFEIEQPAYAGGTYSGVGVENNFFYPQVAGIGIHEITYTLVDEFGFIYACDFTITVNASPEVSLADFASVCDNTEAFVLSGGLPLGGTYSGNGVVDGMFYPELAGAGEHMITYYYEDANGCFGSATATIEVKQSLCFDVVVENVSCYGAEDGSIKVIFTCGPPVQVCVDVIDGDKCLPANKVGFAYFGNLLPGTYVIYFTAPNGCVSTQIVTITQPDEIIINIEEVAPLCSNDEAVELIATPEGGIFTGAGVEGNMFNPVLAAIGANVITYTYTDAYGCVESSEITIVVNAAPVVTLEPVGPFCSDDAVVMLVATPEGGMFSGNGVIGNNFDPSLALIGENVITYVYVAENGCIGEASITITVYPRVEVSLEDFAPVCSNEAAFALTGGLPEGGVYSGVGVVDGMFDPSIAGAGVFEITYTYDDPNGCGGFATASIEVYQTVCVEVTHTDVTCFGAENGTITVKITCGSYVTVCLDEAGDDNCLDATKSPVIFYGGLAPGNYVVYVTDVNGCLVTVPVTIAEPEELVVQVEGTNPVCFGQAGSAAVTVTGGTEPYSFDWGGADPNALFAGSYQVVVTDDNGCEAIGLVTITSPEELLVDVQVQGITCAGADNAVVTVSVDGGTPDYEICLVLVGEGSDCLSGQSLIEPLVGMTFPGLQPGVYMLSVTDANGCMVQDEIVITEPEALFAEAVVSNPACFGEAGSVVINISGGTEPYTIHTDGLDLNAVPAGDYQLMITDANDCMTYVTFSIIAPEALEANPVVTHVSCNGGNDGTVVLNVSGGTGSYTYELFGLDLNNLEAGEYMVIVYDENDCSLSVSFIIEEPVVLTLELNAEEIACFGETTDVISDVNGGVAPYSYLWSTGSTNANLEGVMAGSYSLTVTDANGCSVEESIEITQPEMLEISAVLTHPEAYGDDNGAIETVVTGGSQPYQYIWNTGSTEASIFGLVAGTYSLTVTDAHNCTATGIYTLYDPALVIDLGVVKTISNDTVDSASVVTFTSVITNYHPFATSENIVLVDEMDDVFVYQSHTTSKGVFDPVSFIWTIPALAAGETATLTVDVVIHGEGVNQICIVSASVPDPNPLNDCSAATGVTSGDDGGIESDGNMASKIALRNFRRTVSGNFIEKASRRVDQKQFLMADMITGELKSASVNAQKVSGITQFIPETGPANTDAFVSTPADLLGITNAKEIFAVDYLKKNNNRDAAILALVTDPGVVYDHTKIICDRLAGARLDRAFYVTIRDRRFIMNHLVHQNGEVDYALTFVAFRGNNTFMVDNQWVNEDYPQLGNEEVFNFQVWGSKPEYTIELVENILDEMKAVGNLQFVDNAPVIPELYVREGYYRNGTLHLTVVNKSSSNKMTVKGSKANVEDGSRSPFELVVDLPKGEIIDIEVPVGYVFDAGFTLKGDASKGKDMLYFADGAWGFDHEEFGAFVNNFGTKAETGEYPAYGHVVERSANISGRVTTYASLYRSLNTRRKAENLQAYDELIFTASGKGRVEVMLAKDGIHQWSQQFRQEIELTAEPKTFKLQFNDFVNRAGNKGFTPEDVKTIIFNVLGNGSASSNFDMQVSNVYFGNSLMSATSDGIFMPVYPNPFNRAAHIEFGVTRETNVKVEVMNIFGQVVEVLADETMSQGYYKRTWTPANDKAGVYIIRITIGADTYTGKVVYQK